MIELAGVYMEIRKFKMPWHAIQLNPAAVDLHAQC